MAALRSFAAALAATTLVNHVQAWNIDLPPCLSPFKPFVYSGCFEDGNPNTLSFRSDADSQNMTIEGCMAECKGNGFRYAGLEYYGVCFCGNSVNGAQLDESKCNFPCSGNKSEVCGGDNILSVYQDTTFLPIDDVDTDDYVSLGCYFDDSNIGKALSYPQDSVNGDSLTTEKCLAACKKGGYPFAGTEFGGECWCGVVLGNNTYPTPDSDCNIPCKGNAGETCGGPARLSLYVAKDLESLEPCGYVPPSSSTTSSTVPPTSSSSSASSSSTTSTTTTTSPTSSTKPPTTSKTSTSCTTTTSKPPTTTPKTSTSCTTTPKTTPPTTTKPPTTTPKTSTTPTTSICVTTTTIPSSCEYGCGKWCNQEIPDWNDQAGCKNSHSNCKLQIAACFKSAGFPDSMDCFNYGSWCSSIGDYCSTSPSKGKDYGKKDCFSRKPPTGGKPPTTKTITVPCGPTTTAKTTTKTTTTAKTSTTTTSTSKCPIPTVTNICKQPTNNQYGYKPGNPVGGIDLPVVTCNDLKSDFSQKPFKLYTDGDSSKCGSYTRPQAPNACADACKVQYDQCTATYAQGCKSGGANAGYWDKWFPGSSKPRHRAARDALEPVSEVLEKRTFGWNSDYNGALNKCKAQYGDCLNQNKGVNVNGKCGSWGSGW